MAKSTGPLLSFDARGQIAKTQVYASWRGRQYVRRYVIPANPRTTGQTSVRNAFKLLQNMWKVAPANAQAPWIAAAKGTPATDRNLWTKFNLPPTKSAGDNGDIVFSPGVGGMFPVTGASISGDITAGTLAIAFTAPVLPAGWTLISIQGVAFFGQNAHTSFNPGAMAATTMSTPLTFAAAPTWTDYVAGIWAVATKPDGTTVYSPSITFSTD